jgi:hypothetical protein
MSNPEIEREVAEFAANYQMENLPQENEVDEEKLKEFEKYNKLFNTNRKFRKAVYAQRFSRTAIKPSLK